MGHPEKVTVDKAYFDALLRRADFHTSTQLLGRPDPANVTISRVEYDSLLRASREYELLKAALFQGGITSETLDLLISGASTNDQRKDSGNNINSWSDNYKDSVPAYEQASAQRDGVAAFHDMPWRQTGSQATFNLAPGSGAFRNDKLYPSQDQTTLGAPDNHRKPSYGAPPSSVLDDIAFEEDDEDDFAVEGANRGAVDMPPSSSERRTLYFSGMSERTTYKDLLSVIKGGKLLSVNLRSERSATVTFLEGAAEYLAWTKRNDIYLHSKRVEIKWADRQYHLNGHISNKIMNGATRNMLVRGAFANGLSENQIRLDMDHIHNLVLIDVTFRNGNAYVSTNSVHNALFARTCMMSRTTYKGCKIEFLQDECDVPLPAPASRARPPPPGPAKKKAPIVNRFNLLNIDGSDSNTDEDDYLPGGRTGADDETIDATSNMGVSLI